MTFDPMNLNFGKVTTAEVRECMRQARAGWALMEKLGQSVAPDSIAAWTIHAMESLADQLDRANALWTFDANGAHFYHPETYHPESEQAQPLPIAVNPSHNSPPEAP